MADLWHYTHEGKPLGPVPVAELRKLATSGLLKPTDLVWREGMADWVRASASGAGLFADSSPNLVLDRAAPALLERAQDKGDPQPERRPRREANDFASPDRPRRRRYRPEGMSSGAKTAIVLFAILLLVGLIVGGVLLTIGSHRAGTIQAGKPTVYTVELNAGGLDSRFFQLRANIRYDITITSDNHADLDFYIVGWNDQDEVMQNNIGPNHRLTWVPPRSGQYRLELESHGAIRTRSTVTIREAGPGIPNNALLGKFKNEAAKAGAQNVAIIGNPHTIGPKGLTLKGSISNRDSPDQFPGEPPCHVYGVNMEAGKTYTIDLISNEFDAFLRLEDQGCAELAAHDDIIPAVDQNAKIVFRCQRTDVYRVVVRPLEVFDPTRNRISQGQYTLEIRDN